MPYAQFFNGGQALHGTKDLFSSGSGGCVNLAMTTRGACTTCC